MNSQEIKTLINNWVNTKNQFEAYNDKLEELAKEILRYVKDNYEELLASFAHGHRVYFNEVSIDDNKLFINYTDNWADCPDYAWMDMPIKEISNYKKYFENLYDEYINKENQKIKDKEKAKEEQEYQTYLELKKKFEE